MDIKHRLSLYVCSGSLEMLLREAVTRIIELEEYDRDGEISGLKRDYKDIHRQFVQQTQEIALAQDRNLYLEGKLKTAKADGIREAVNIYEDSHGYQCSDFADDLRGYAGQLEADNEQT